METTTTFDVTLAEWLEAVRVNVLTQVNDEWQRKFGKLYTTLDTDAEGQKFIRIVATNGGQRSCWAFVAKSNGQNQKMGAWCKGDIFKPDGWRSPSRYARGNIFENRPLCGIHQWTGPNYIQRFTVA
jgi:hypothetical protein